MKTDNTLQSSNVTPFVGKYNVGGSMNSWHVNPMGDVGGKKLRRVAMSRSYTHQDGIVSTQV